MSLSLPFRRPIRRPRNNMKVNMRDLLRRPGTIILHHIPIPQRVKVPLLFLSEKRSHHDSRDDGEPLADLPPHTDPYIPQPLTMLPRRNQNMSLRQRHNIQKRKNMPSGQDEVCIARAWIAQLGE
ncbi:hypothetical protein BDQ94DRAFT_137438 [Aspergillus welwitschiae]|uniref:Uncharacterized protein n=1 Tax=Aspergillus welwitschiae TaxID=1341132 RepID=A0A3F3QCS3_9EURO|nr:hypothetical protein BDQ94DRAFT_137438 [Aspergillus welwitschiae]RDH37074.1 hypothetical protein BDQ94DRAFT_137438 [Aspergillus welwitschiae]